MKTTLSQSFGPLPSVLVWGLVSTLTPVGAGAAVVTFTNDTVIGDTSYDGQDIVIRGCTVTANGAHSFNSVQLFGDGVLTHPATTANQEYSLQLAIASNLVVDATSAIDVSGKGYLPGYTLGNTTEGASVGAGGSYGGLGAVGSGNPNAVYGDYRNPNELGSGGNDAPGGGLVRITAGAATIDGAIRANGATSGSSGGSGGGILLNVGTLAGAGSLSANGGAAWGNGLPASGGGGRIALGYGLNHGFDTLGLVTATAGPVGLAGAVGTVYLNQTGGEGVLRIDSHGARAGAWTPLGMSGETNFVVDRLVISGTNVVAAPQHQMPVQANNVTIQSGGVLTHQAATTNQEYSLQLSIASNLVVDATSAIDVSGRGYLPGCTLGNTTQGGSVSGGGGSQAGGSYGGLGGNYVAQYGAGSGSANAVYGDYRNPNELGSGGTDAPGGGLVRIAVGAARIDGAIRANGASNGASGGSGGGILLNAGTLAGAGSISANGGVAWGNGSPASGGGGRVAIDYALNNGFDVVNNVMAIGAARAAAGGVGTVYLNHTGGEAVLRIDSHGAPAGAWTPLGMSGETNFVVDRLVISGTNVVAAPQHQMPVQANNVTIQTGGVLTHQAATTNQEYSLQLAIASNLVVDASSAIDVSGLGYLPGYTLGNTTQGGSVAGGPFQAGGSYGGLGGSFTAQYGVLAGSANAVYGDFHAPNQLGSGGCAASGGGLVRITAGAATIDGAIRANGAGSGSSGGSGGGVLLNLGALAGAGSISANGGTAWGNGLPASGGGGRVAIYTWSGVMTFAGTNVAANGGTRGAAGAAGSVWISSQPWFGFSGLPVFWHGAEHIAWFALGVNPGDLAEVRISSAGATADDVVTIASGAANWNTTTRADGNYDVQVVFRDASGQTVGQISQNELVNNSVTWHGGVITANETWMAGTVHAIDSDVTIPNGVTVTIQTGAIVKFAKGTGITVLSGGVLTALGTADAPVVLTSLADDTAGGDANLDGDNSRPEPGDWSGITLQGGQFNQTPYVDLRYAWQSHAGLVAASETWLGSYVHLVAGNLTVPAGGTLTINPGAVVKFAAGAGITVTAGGSLNAPGTVALPIAFTSIKDDSVGGDSNGDGSATTPAPGDWVGLSILGQTALNHCDIRYGGNTGSGGGASGVIIVDGGSLVLSNSTLESTLYDGISVSGGNALIVNTILRDIDRVIWAIDGGYVHLLDCTFDQNIAGLDNHGGGVIEAENCIIANSITGSSIEGAVTLRYCDLWSEYPGAYNPPVIGQSGNISADPKFVNKGQQDYRLNYGSPCIDAADTTVAPAQDAAGSPRYNEPRTVVKTGLPSTNGIYADMGAFEFVETAPSDVDLVATTVSGPATVGAGDIVKVQWTVANIGTAIAVGPWHDTISLASSDGANTLLSVGDALEGQGAVLSPGQTYSASSTFQVPGGTEGNYFWQVHVNSRGDIYEGANWTNNTALAAESTALTVPLLSLNGAAITNAFTVTGQTTVFKVLPVPGQDVLLSLAGTPSGSALELYVGQGYVPGPAAFDFKSSQFDWSTVSVLVPSPSSSVCYVTVYARSLNTSTVAYTVAATTPTQFALNGVSPSGIPVTGVVTLRVYGSLLGLGDLFQVVGPGGTFPATALVIPDSTTAYATFDLGGAAAGVYSLRATEPGGLTLSLSNSIKVGSAAVAPQLSLELQLPPSHRTGRPINGAVVYGDSGNSDMPAPILILTSGHTAGMRLFPTDSYSTNDLLLIGASLEGPAGVLRPGQTWRIPFSALATYDVTIPFEVDYETAEATDAADYPALAAQVRPAGYSDSDWNTAWNYFQAEAGPTWGGFVALMARYSTIVADKAAAGQEVGTFYLLRDVFAYAIADTLVQAQTSVTGTLFLNDTNHPLAYAELYLANADASQSGADQTIADGTFRVGSLSNDTYTVDVPGYWLPSPVTVTVPTNGPVTGLVVVARRGGAITGVIRNLAGTAFLTSVPVQAVASGTNGFFTANTGADGSYRLSGLPPGTYALSAGGGAYQLQTIAGLSLSDGQTLVSDFLLPNAAAIQGQVFGNGLPVSDAVVFFTDAAGNQTSIVTDRTGAFAGSGLAAGAYTVQVEAQGFAPLAIVTNLAAGMTLNTGNLSLQPGATITATFDDASTRAVTNGIVTLLQNGNEVAWQYNTNGQAVFSDLAAGTYLLTVDAYGFRTVSNTITVTAGATVSNAETLPALGSIAGRVTDGGGQPIANIEVNVYGVGSTNQDVAFTVETDAAGSYTLLGLPAGPYLVTVGNDGGIDERPVTVPPTLALQTLNFTLANSLVQGQVLEEDGVTPLGNATVNLCQDNQLIATATTDTNGFYRFRVLLPGSYTIAAGSFAAGLSPNLMVKVSSDTNLAVAALQIGNVLLGGIVTDAGGAALTNATVMLFRADGPPAPAFFIASTSDGGQFAIGGLAAGTYMLEVRQSGYAPCLQPLSVTASTNLALALAPGITMAGTITDAVSALGIPNATVSFIDPATHFPIAIAQTDSQGNYTADDLAAARYDVVINQGQYQIAALANVLAATDSAALNAALAATNTPVQGTVTDTAANPVANAQVSMVDTNTGETLAQAVTAADGTWSTAQLPPGAYGIAISALGYLAPPPTTIALAAGVPQVVASVVTPAATDEVPGGVTGFFVMLSQIIGTGLFEATEIPRPKMKPYLQLPDVKCVCAVKAFAAALRAEEKMVNAYNYWQGQFDADATVTGASAGIAGADSLRLLGDLLAYLAPGGAVAKKINNFRKLSYTGLNAVFDAQKLTLGADSIKAVVNFLDANQETIKTTDWSDPDSVRAGLAAIGASVNDVAGLLGGIKGIKDLINALKPGATEGITAVDPTGVIVDLLSVTVDIISTYQDWKDSLNALSQAQLDYLEAYHAYQEAYKAYLKANKCDNCPPPPPSTPPKSTTSKPGDKQNNPVQQSTDPNDKLSGGVGGAGFVPPGQPITYTIDFENQASATAPAQTVSITDQLDANLDWSTLQLGTVGFNHAVVPLSPGLQFFTANVSVATDPNAVQVTASLNPTNGVLSWYMQSINRVTGLLVEDPLAGFLPPNDSTGSGLGYVTYSVQPKSGLASGTIITNQAAIVFDVNAPILTDIATNTLDASAPASSVTAQPLGSWDTNLVLSWAGTDAGSRIASYDVYVSANGEPWAEWLAGTTNVSAIFPASLANSYAFFSLARDHVGNRQPVPSAPDLTLAPLTVSVSGDGSLAPDYTGTGFKQVGASYTITAIPGFGNALTGWTGGLTSSANSLTFTMRAGLVLQANFAPIPYTQTNGTYYGLFYPTNGITHAQSGAITLTTAAKRNFTAKLQIAGASYSISGQFDPTGVWSKDNIPRLKQSSLNVQLVMRGTDALLGSVSAADWTAAIIADRAVYDGKKSFAPQMGQYTLVIAGTNGSTLLPAGYGYGTLAVSAAGKTTFAGSLADGTKLSQSAVVGAIGQCPLYIPLYQGKGSLLSWLAFNGAQDLGGGLAWSKPNLPTSKYYPAEFSWLTSVSGAAYHPPGKGTNVLGLTSSSLTLTLEGGNLSRTVTSQFTLDANNQAKDANGKKVNVTFTPATGLFKGSVPNPDAPRKTVSFNGVVLQNQTNGWGYFLGTNQSGQVYLGH
jgi:uncharacterized repeat protein (TIGR01451 family)